MAHATDLYLLPSTSKRRQQTMRPPPSPFPCERQENARFQDETLLLHTAPIFSPGPVELGDDEDWGDSFALGDDEDGGDSPQPGGIGSVTIQASPRGRESVNVQNAPQPRGIESANELSDVFEREQYTGRGERIARVAASRWPESGTTTSKSLESARTTSKPLEGGTTASKSLAPSTSQANAQEPRQAPVKNKMRVIHPPTPTQHIAAPSLPPVPAHAKTALARYLAKEHTDRLDVFGPPASRPRQEHRAVPAGTLTRLPSARAVPSPSKPPSERSEVVPDANPVQVTATTPSWPDSVPPVPTDPDAVLTRPSSPAPDPSPIPSAPAPRRSEASTPITPTTTKHPTPSQPIASSSPPQPVYPSLPTAVDTTRETATETPRRQGRKGSLTASVQSFFAGLLHKTPVKDPRAITDPSAEPNASARVPQPGPQSSDIQSTPVKAQQNATARSLAQTVNLSIPPVTADAFLSRNAIERSKIVQQTDASSLRRTEKRKRRDNDTGPPKVTRIRLFGPEAKPPRAATQKNLASTKPSSRPERSLVSQTRLRESPKRPWREAARARGATQQQTQTLKPPAIPPISRTQLPPAPLQLTKPKPFAFTQPRVPVERAQDVVKPHERAKDIAARKAVFERQAHRPSVTVPEVGRTPGRLIRQRVEERRLFELGLRQRDDEKRKAKEEAERERLRLEAAEDAQRRKETIIWAHPVPDMYRRPGHKQ